MRAALALSRCAPWRSTAPCSRHRSASCLAVNLGLGGDVRDQIIDRRSSAAHRPQLRLQTVKFVERVLYFSLKSVVSPLAVPPDVGEFINAWFADQVNGTLVADWDHNGIVNSTDVGEFVNDWFEDIVGPCAV